VAAAVLAVMLAMALELIMRASHPPAAATTLLVALGSCRPTVRDTVALVVGVLLLAAVGEALRRLRLRSGPPDPTSPDAGVAAVRAALAGGGE
jgi:CBS-domain-containing membrane protein